MDMYTCINVKFYHGFIVKKGKKSFYSAKINDLKIKGTFKEKVPKLIPHHDCFRICISTKA